MGGTIPVESLYSPVTSVYRDDKGGTGTLVVPSQESPGMVHSYTGVQEYSDKGGILHASGTIPGKSW